MDCGVNKKDIQKAIDEQEQMIADLTSALNGTSKESFEECFKRWLGIDYDEEAIMDYYETSQTYSIAFYQDFKT